MAIMIEKVADGGIVPWIGMLLLTAVLGGAAVVTRRAYRRPNLPSTPVPPDSLGVVQERSAQGVMTKTVVQPLVDTVRNRGRH